MLKRRIMLMIAAMITLMTMNEITALAAQFNGDMTLEEGAEPGVITEDAIDKEKSLLLQRTTYPSACTINVTCYKQETDYWCGPATVQQVIKWVTGTKYEQSTLASALGTTTAGTDMTKIPGVLNDYIDEEHYVYASIEDQSSWYEKIQSSVYNDRPAVLDIDTTKVDAFAYNTSGHFVNVSGYDTSENKVRITDPYKGKGNVWYSADDLYTANSNHWRQAIVW